MTRLLLLLLVLAAPLQAVAQSVSEADAAEATDLYERGLAAFRDGQISVAAAHFRGALAADPDHHRARSYLIECLVLQGNDDEARAVAEGRDDARVPPPVDPLPPDEPMDDGWAEAADQPMTEEEAAERREEAARMQEGAWGQDEPMSEDEAAARREEAARMQAEARARHANEAEARRINQEEARAQAAARAELEAEQKAVRKRERAARFNPRSLSHVAGGVAFGGSAGAIGGFGELRLHWTGAMQVGIGGFLVRRGDDVDPAVTLSVEGQLNPIPFRLTPVIGAGVVTVLGDGAPALDGILAGASRGNARLIPYALFGARYDFRKHLWFALSVRLAPSPSPRFVMPMPGARIGLRF